MKKNNQKALFLIILVGSIFCFHNEDIEHSEDTPRVHHAPQSHLLIEYCLSCNTHLNGEIELFIKDDAPKYSEKQLKLDPRGTSTPILKVFDSYGNPTRKFDLSNLTLRELRQIISNYGLSSEKQLHSYERVILNQKSKGKIDNRDFDSQLHIEEKMIHFNEPIYHEIDPIITLHEQQPEIIIADPKYKYEFNDDL